MKVAEKIKKDEGPDEKKMRATRHVSTHTHSFMIRDSFMVH